MENERARSLFIHCQGPHDLFPADKEQAHLAAQAFRRYGKGRHPAALNLI
jgi:uncharacterized protein with PIN domain